MNKPPIHGVECDVRLTRDGQVVCTHDRTMERVAGDPTVVSQATAGQLKKLNIAQTFAPNPEAPASSRYPASYPPAGLPPIGQPLVQHLLTLDELLDMVFATDDKHLYIETPVGPAGCWRNNWCCGCATIICCRVAAFT